VRAAFLHREDDDDLQVIVITLGVAQVQLGVFVDNGLLRFARHVMRSSLPDKKMAK
jgi:hypothetical protein